jgi:DUF917 family protein
MPTGPSSPSADGERRLAPADVDDLVRGARLLGGGGGGDPTALALLTHRALSERPVRIADPAELPTDGLVIAAAMIGSPAIMAELLPDGEEFVRAFAGLERHLGRSAVAVMGLETAGVNAFAPILVAAALDLPVVDLDGMGRAFPRLDTTILHARGAPAGPMTLTGTGGELMVIDVPDAVRAEALARVSLAALGGWGGTASFPVTVEQAVRCTLHGTLARALALGRASVGAASAADLAARTGAEVVTEGRVIAVERRADRHGPRGSLLIEPAAEEGATLRVEFQTEYLLAILDGRLAAATPDPIVLLRGHDLAPIPCDAVRRGDDVAVLTLAAAPGWHEPAALAVAGPRAFGYETDR